MPVLSEPLLTGHTENKEAEQTAPLSLSLLSSTSLGPGDVSLSVKALELMEQRQVRRVPELAKRMHCHSAKKKKKKKIQHKRLTSFTSTRHALAKRL